MRVTDNDFYGSDSVKPSGGTFSFSDIRWLLRRGWLFPLVGTLLGMTLALTVMAFMPQLYTSNVRIIVDRSMNRFLQDTKIVDQPVFDDVDMAGQFYVLSSDSIIIPVIRKLDLTSDPEFVGKANTSGIKAEVDPCASRWDGTCIMYQVRNLKNGFKRIIGWKSAPPLDRDVFLERTAAETFLRRLSVERGDVNNVMSIGFSSEDPTKAAKIVNAIADTYIATVGERKVESNKFVTQLLASRLLDTKQQSINADRALQDFKVSNNLTGTETADNPLIARLRSEYVDLERKANDIAAVVGPNHMAVTKVRKQMDSLNAAIRGEEERIGDVDALKIVDTKREYHNIEEDYAPDPPSEELKSRLNKLDSTIQAKYRELEFTAHTLRVLYHADLRRFDELNQTPTGAENAHIITRGSPPLHKDPNKAFLVLGGGIVFGFLSGLGALVGREWAAGIFRTPQQVANVIDAPCIILPTITARKSSDGRLDDYVLDAPYSRYTESIRKIRAQLRALEGTNRNHVVGVISSVAHEGKTTVAHNFAALLSSYSGCRTLLIDCDIHRQKPVTGQKPEPREGLFEALDSPSQLEKFVSKRARSGVDVLPCILDTRNPNVAELLGSRKMETLLNAAREAYDFIIIEIAPIVSVVDLAMMERFIDHFIFVVEWGVTKQSLVEDALSESQTIRDRIACAVLNKVDPVALRTMEGSQHKRTGDYFSE